MTAALDAEPGLVGAAGGAALMMLENARLEADLRASVADLRASRARLASAADAGTARDRAQPPRRRPAAAGRAADEAGRRGGPGGVGR